MLLDELMPVYDVVERHRIIVHAAPEIVFAAIREADLGRGPLTRTLLTVRAVPAAVIAFLRSPRAARASGGPDVATPARPAAGRLRAHRVSGRGRTASGGTGDRSARKVLDAPRRSPPGSDARPLLGGPAPGIRAGGLELQRDSVRRRRGRAPDRDPRLVRAGRATEVPGVLVRACARGAG